MIRNGYGWFVFLTAFSLISAFAGNENVKADTGLDQYSRECQVENWPHDLFTSEIWKKTKKMARYRFVQSLLESPEIVGGTREYIINLLGPPDGNYKDYLSYIVREFDPEECIHGFIALLHFDIGSDGIVKKAFVRLD